MDQEKASLDAGLSSLNHYRVRLPRWRYNLRERLLPLVRWETPYVAQLQEKMRSPALDTYFAVSANLGTHTFFMVVLPILFWCGYTNLGRNMVHILASGVFFSGFVKDMLCLPRPLSPPLQRITMSDSAALEYGFPSTHSTNAVSVAVYTLFVLNFEQPGISPLTSSILQVFAYWYAFSIVLGRVYCGMHGFFDVVIGSLLGGFLSMIQCLYGADFDAFVFAGINELWLVILMAIVLVRIHPEPADNCPCFDDSVAFAGVFIGVEFGIWHFASTSYSWPEPFPGTVPFDLAKMGWVVTILRIVLGVVTIFAWRAIMKPTLLTILPPIFRVVEALGLTLPRRFFKQASEYTRVPKQRNDDNIIPQAADIPHMLNSFRRKRAVSIGPQSEADAYETLAYRQRRRRASSLTSPMLSPAILPEDANGHPGLSRPQIFPNGNMTSNMSTKQPVIESRFAEHGDEVDDKELFAKLLKPRVRYDVEVITKLIVYSGIAWLAVEGNPLLFQVVGLGLRQD